MSDEYSNGVKRFIEEAINHVRGLRTMNCPCKACMNGCRQAFDIVYEHLVINWIDPSYSTWIFHGESLANISQSNEDTSNIRKIYEDANFQDNLQSSVNDGDDCVTSKLEDAKTPLYGGCKNYNKISAIVALYKIKATYGISDKGFDDILYVVKNMLPGDNVLPESLKATKKLLQVFDLGYEKIDACINSCCLFRRDLADLDYCPKCS